MWKKSNYIIINDVLSYIQLLKYEKTTINVQILSI